MTDPRLIAGHHQDQSHLQGFSFGAVVVKNCQPDEPKNPQLYHGCVDCRSQGTAPPYCCCMDAKPRLPRSLEWVFCRKTTKTGLEKRCCHAG
ncbi:hypothetical protein DM01DRAFT_3769 [Hesseltinella vesiculosa]|uniref:Uncharacterized protein n=1 Tax=Hesseltinella vesiculosa TaxID=101127 RepID=A0A1X2GSY2_9FUNG|nr:hypothetical protein DM01DRAFT_3769 [Hesseltinella vesiculosa]